MDKSVKSVCPWRFVVSILNPHFSQGSTAAAHPASLLHCARRLSTYCQYVCGPSVALAEMRQNALYPRRLAPPRYETLEKFGLKRHLFCLLSMKTDGFSNQNSVICPANESHFHFPFFAILNGDFHSDGELAAGFLQHAPAGLIFTLVKPARLN